MKDKRKDSCLQVFNWLIISLVYMQALFYRQVIIIAIILIQTNTEKLTTTEAPILCGDVSTNDKAEGCPTHFNLYVVTLLDPIPSHAELAQYYSVIKKLTNACVKAENASNIFSSITLLVHQADNLIPMKDLPDTYNKKFYFNYSVKCDNGKHIIDEMLSIVSHKVKDKQNVVYIMTNFKCKTVETKYPYLLQQFKSFADKEVNRGFLAVFRFFWLNETSQNFDCGMVNLTERTYGMADYVTGSLGELNTTLSEQKFGMCPNAKPTSIPIMKTTIGKSAPEAHPRKSASWPWFAYIGVIIACIVVVLVFFFSMRRLFCRTWIPWHTSTNMVKRGTHAEDIFIPSGRLQERGNAYMDHTKAVSRDPWEVYPSNLQISDEKLGSGAYADVFKGVLSGTPPVSKAIPKIQLTMLLSDEENEVAVKCPLTSATKQERMEFLKEIDFMKELEYYPYLLSMLGCSTDPEFPLLVTELCELGDFLHLLRDMQNEQAVLEFKDLLPIVWQISDALAFLSHKKIVHRDIAARNVLVTETKMAKLSDFGLCRCTQEMYYTTRGGKLPIKWMAPESIQFAKFSSKSDVWSFGVFLFEVYSQGRLPYNHVQQEDMLKYLKTGRRLAVPDGAPEEIGRMMARCFEQKPALRPGFTELRGELYELMEKNSDAYGYLQFSGQYYKFSPTAKGSFEVVGPDNTPKANEFLV